jgi:hypothetical protein
MVQYFRLVFTIFKVPEGPIHGGNELHVVWGPGRPNAPISMLYMPGAIPIVGTS